MEKGLTLFYGVLLLISRVNHLRFRSRIQWSRLTLLPFTVRGRPLHSNQPHDNELKHMHNTLYCLRLIPAGQSRLHVS